MFNVYISNDYNILEIYQQISPIFLAIVVKNLRYIAWVRCLLSTEPQYEQKFGSNSTGNICADPYRTGSRDFLHYNKQRLLRQVRQNC